MYSVLCANTRQDITTLQENMTRTKTTPSLNNNIISRTKRLFHEIKSGQNIPQRLHFQRLSFFAEVTFNSRIHQDVVYSVQNIKFDSSKTETIPKAIQESVTPLPFTSKLKIILNCKVK